MSDTETQPVQLTLNDLNLMANIINVCTKRGAFEASEMQPAGQLFNRLKAFLAQAQAQVQAQTEQNLPAVEEETPAEEGTGAAESKEEA
tara:strand:- start:644 stop:910 length:267 start_codon:yes stop_codon:yes gene_type:complete